MGPSLLSAYLEAQKETQTAFAARAGVNGGALSLWLAGKRGPDVTSALAIETATGGAVPMASWARTDGRRHDPKPVRRASKRTPKQAS